MHNRLKQVFTLIRSPVGRRELALGAYYCSMPLLGRIAKAYRRTVIKKTRLIAVTGSFNKTTTSRAIKCALGLPIDPRVGVTQPTLKVRELLRIRAGDPYGVIETSIEAPGQMAIAADFTRPDIAVITSIGTEHRRVFGSLEAIRNEKAWIVRSLSSNGLAVLNGDDPNVLWSKGETKARVITFGCRQDNDIFASEVSIDWPYGTRFRLSIGKVSRWLRIRLIGRHMVYAALAAVAVATSEGRGLDQVCTALERLEPTPGRMQPIRLSNGAILLRDDFKSPLETIETALATLREIPAERKIVVLGQVSEAPGNAKEVQRQLGRLIAQSGVSYAIFLGVNCQPYVKGASRAGMDRSSILDAKTNPGLAIQTLAPMLRDGDVVLIKGRSSEKLERIALALTGRRVGCLIGFCDAESRCSNCKMLEKGWSAHPQISPARRQ
jgi:UDP-N-acetylmuramoyl-tripeptide--D-alanyl-D-alanine ligase